MDLIENEIRRYILEHTSIESPEVIQADTSLTDLGLLDSVLIVALAAFCEERFRVVLDFEDMTESNFRSVRALAALVAKGTTSTF